MEKLLSDHAGAFIAVAACIGSLLITLLAWLSVRSVYKVDASLLDHGCRIASAEKSIVTLETNYENWAAVSEGLRAAIENNTETMSRLREAVANVGIQIETQVTETFRLRDKTDNLSNRIVALESR
jgi:hypothetical protein